MILLISENTLQPVPQNRLQLSELIGEIIIFFLLLIL